MTSFFFSIFHAAERLLLIAFFNAVLPILVAQSHGVDTSGDNLATSGSNDQRRASHDAEAVLALVNQDRSARGLGLLALNSHLVQAALTHARDMARNGFFEHTGSDDSTVGVRANRAGYTWRMIAENIASGQRDAREVHAGWMNSPGHRANILRPEFTVMGLARVGDIWVQTFGCPRE